MRQSGLNKESSPAATHSVAGDDATSAAHSAIAALARGVAPLANSAFPWPPPSYLWPRRAAADILSSDVIRRRKKRWDSRGRTLSLGSEALDEQFARCFTLGSVVEIVGKAGSGKTQLALTLTAETIIQRYEMQTACAHDCRSVIHPSLPDLKTEATDECLEWSKQRNTFFKEAPSCYTCANVRKSGKNLKSCLKCASKPAVVYYLHTEGAFPVRRLHEILFHRHRRECVAGGKPYFPFSCTAGEFCAGAKYPSVNVCTNLLMQRVFTEKISGEEELWLNLTCRLPRLTISHRVVLVVVDCIAAVFRAAMLETDCARGVSSPAKAVRNLEGKASSSHQLKGGLIDRASKLFRVGAFLRRLCTKHNFCCLVLNQVSDTMEDPSRPCHNQHDYALYTQLPVKNPNDEVHEGAVKEDSSSCRITPLRWPSGFCDGIYVWNGRSALGPVLGNVQIQPSLGLTWGNCVDSRLMLQKIQTQASPLRNHSASGVGEVARPLRRCCAVFGSYVSIRDVVFIVDASGVVVI